MKIRSRRGAGLEMAMLLLVVVMGLSVLLTSVVTMQTVKLRRAEEKLEQRLVLEQVGRDFCRYRESYIPSVELVREYSIANNDTTLQVYPQGETQPVLTVELELDGEYYIVTKWSYGE